MRARLILAALLAATVAPLVVAAPPAVAEYPEAVDATGADLQRRITVGALHTCAVLDNGHVQCWGNNDNGQLGNGTTAETTRPISVVGITTALQVSAGATQTCALIHDSTVSCWGHNGSGQLGNGSTTDSLVPVAVPGLSGVTQIGVGAFHACAIVGTGSIKCWGHNGSGQLGDGATGRSLVPVDVPGITNATGLALGEFHTCALLADGKVKCWGHNGFGQVGDGTTDTRLTPVAVSNIPDGTKTAKTITAGWSHTCATLSDGTARCWGLNEHGQLGDGTQTSRSTPVTVQFDGDPSIFVVDPDPVEGIKALTAGQIHTCALISDGTGRCWGNATRGQVGDGTEEARRTLAVPVNGLSGGTAITAGGFTSCALTGTTMQCWGYNFYGQLGSYASESLRPVEVTSLTGVVTVAVGNGHACAVREDNKPVCWGANNLFQLGSGLTIADTTIPVPVSGTPTVSSIDAGNGHVCILPSAQCWGFNGTGQLGDGTTANRNAPTGVSGLTTATQISVGGASFPPDRGLTCARLSNGTAQCWGRNGFGQVGDGTTGNDRLVPTTVKYDADPDEDTVDLQPLPDIVEVTAGGFHGCARRSDSTVWCWGHDGDGQLGDNTPEDRAYAAPVKATAAEDAPALTGATQITAGGFHTCARTSDARVRCWGRNSSGQLGDGTTGGKRFAVLVVANGLAAFDGTVTSVTAGDFHTCAIVPDTGVRCWGENGEGQLGTGGTGDSARAVTPVGMDPPSEVATLVTSLSANRANTCVRTVDTTARCWGDNTTGQLGDGIGSVSLVLRTVTNLGGAIAGNKIPAPKADAFTTSPGVPVAVSVLGNDTDPDGTALTVSGNDDPPHGSLTLSSSGTGTYTPDAGWCGTDTFAYRATDGIATVPATVKVTATCPNNGPDAVDDAVATAEDAAATLALKGNDTDADGDATTVTSNTAPANGTATVAADGTGTYTPNADFCGTDTFTYTLEDGKGGSDTATVTVTVTCVNDAPVAVDDTASTPEDTPIDINVTGNDTDADTGDTLGVASAGVAGNGGTHSPAPATVRYSPNPGFCGTDVFEYVVSDGDASDTGLVTVTVTCVNDGPNANDDAASTHEDTAVVVKVLENDVDPEGDALTVTAVTAPAHGTSAIDAGSKTVTYTPAANFCGIDTFAYTVSDGSSSDTASVVPVEVVCHNDAPTANADAATTGEDQQAGVDVLANDTDPDTGDVLTVSSVTDPAHGSASPISSGVVSYVPDADFCGTDTFDYTATDNHGTSATSTATVTVTCVNDAPVVGAVGNRSTAWGDVLSIPLAAGDPDNASHTWSVVSGPAGVAVDPSTGAFSWTPSAGQVGAHSVTVQASDGAAADTETFSVAVGKRPTSLVYTGVGSAQHSDPAAVSASLTSGGLPVVGRSVTFAIGTRSVAATSDGSGAAAGSIVIGDPAGASSVSMSFPGDAAYEATTANAPFTITRESVAVTVTGTHLTVTTASSAPAELSASVVEEADGHLGSSIATLDVRFDEVGGTTLCTAPVMLTSAGKGTAACSTAALPLGSRGVVATVVGASYGGPVDVSAFTVTQAVTGDAVGGGQVGSSDDFAFRARPVRRSTPAGEAVHVYRAVTDLGDGPRLYAFVVRSTSLSGLANSCGGGKTKVCTTTVDAAGLSWTAIDVATGVAQPVTGAATMRITATDGTPDQYGVTIGSYTVPSSPLSAGTVRIPS
ncbi:MAG TPA: Ig-like domain-containing protein [Acidimicrobiales bacterium]|nr:Ig-like domain-containing protein [Acidimicrobiales bacterium]